MIKYRFKRRIFNIIMLVISYSLIVSLVGCEAFVRKFTRKKKADDVQEELVLAPEEYKNPLTKEEQYRQHFSFWKSWQDELVESLLQKKSNKKLKSCADEAIKNLISMRNMLTPEKQKKIDVYIDQMQGLRNSIASDIYGANSLTFKEKADRIKLTVSKDFAYKDMAKFLQ